MRAQRVIRGKRLGSIQDGAFRDEGSARCCSSQSVLTAWSASQGHDMGVCGLAAAGAVEAMSPGTADADADGGCACALAAVVHSSRGARSAIQHRPGWTLKRSPAPRRLQPRQAGAGVWSALALHWHCTGTKAAAILSPPPPVSLFPQSLSLFPSLRQLSCTCTTQRVPCVALPIAAFPARLALPRPSSFKLPPCALLNRIRLLLHRLPAARCTLGTSRLARSCCCSRRALRCQCALLSHPSLPKFPPPACRALASPPVTAAGLRARAGAVLLFAGSAVPPRSALPVSLHLHSLLAATKGFSTRLFTCLVLSPSAPAFPHSSTRP